MTTVFLGGSRHISRLNDQFRQRLDNIIEKEFPVIVGDANGADKAIQQYLDERRYQFVEVFCSGADCRNNIGNWTKRSIAAETRYRDARFYAEKDRAMAQEATVGLMVWDGKSRGTLFNAFRLLQQGKMVLIFVAPEKRFLELKGMSDWERVKLSLDVDLRLKIEEQIKSESATHNNLMQQTLFGVNQQDRASIARKLHG